MDYIWCFEFETDSGERQFIEVVNTCRHHYTGEVMRYVRRDYVGILSDLAYSVYEYVNEAQWADLLSRRVKEDKN